MYHSVINKLYIQNYAYKTALPLENLSECGSLRANLLGQSNLLEPGGSQISRFNNLKTPKNSFNVERSLLVEPDAALPQSQVFISYVWTSVVETSCGFMSQKFTSPSENHKTNLLERHNSNRQS